MYTRNASLWFVLFCGALFGGFVQLHAILQQATIANGRRSITYKMRSQNIQNELLAIDSGSSGASPDAPDWAKVWAGTYHTSGLSGYTIQFAPQSGITFVQWGCLGTCGENHGVITMAGPEGMTVRWADAETDDPILATQYYFVRWGSVQYLISHRNIVGFIEQYNAGNRDLEAMMFYGAIKNIGELKLDKESFFKGPPGRPVLPVRYAKLLVDSGR